MTPPTPGSTASADPGAAGRASVALLAVAATLVVWSSVEFMLVALQDAFRLSADTTIVVTQVGPAACLTVVFLAGALTDRFGARPVLTGASVVFGAGAVVVAVSPGPVVLTLGLALAGIGTVVLAIARIAVLYRAFPDPARRARGFGGFAIVAPVVSVAVPVAVGWCVPVVGWRPVPVLWLALAATVAGLARRCLPPGAGRAGVELVTPTLAGLALGAGALTVSFLAVDARSDDHFPHAIASLAAGLLAAVAFVAVLRRRPAATTDPRWLRSDRVLPVIGAVFLVNSVNLFFLTFLLLQYRYHQPLLDTALVAAGILGAGAFLVTATSPAWVPVMVLTLVAVPAAAAVGPVTEAFMDRAPPDGIGTGSAWRNSTATLGVAVGGFLVSAVVFAELDADTERTLAAYREQAAAYRLGGALCVLGALAAGALIWWSGRSASRQATGTTGLSDART